jgi:hypothetical protein
MWAGKGIISKAHESGPTKETPMAETRTKELLSIRNFAGISELDVPLSKINVLIGPQAAGKSIVAKLFFYFKGAVTRFMASGRSGKESKESDEDSLRVFEDYFPHGTLGPKVVSDIRYSIGDEFIRISAPSGKGTKPLLTYSDGYRETLADAQTLSVTALRKNGLETDSIQSSRVVAKAAFRKRASARISPTVLFSQLFVPAGRSIFAILQKNIFTFLQTSSTIDPFLKNFGATYEGFKSFLGAPPALSRDMREAFCAISTLLEDVLGGRFVSVRGEDMLDLPDGRRVDMAHSSSAQQELLPLAVILASVPYGSWLGEGGTFYIEEPEAHLFPITQKQVVELIANVFNATCGRDQFIITTHSPYILTSMNNLLVAGKLSTRIGADQAKLSKIVSPSSFLSSADVSAFYLGGGKGTPIMDAETGLIRADAIDSASDAIASEFDRLVELEMQCLQGKGSGRARKSPRTRG